MPEDRSRSSWRRHRFDQMAAVVNDRIDNPSRANVAYYVGLEHLDPGSLAIRRWGSPSDVEATKLYFRTGDIIFGRRRVYLRKLAVAHFDGICSAHAMVLRARPEVALPVFLPFYMQTDHFMERAKQISVGSLSPTINWKTLAKEEFVLPPLEEQLRFATILQAASTAQTAATVAMVEVSSLRRAASSEWFAGILRRAPEGKELGSYLDQITDRGHTGLPILSITIDGTVVRRDSLGRHVSDQTGDAKYIRAQAGDIAYNTMRLWQGAIGIVEEEGLISPAYTVMRPHSDVLPVEYFWELLRSPPLQREYRRLVRGVASDRWRVYFDDLATIQIALPATPVAIRQIRALTDLKVAANQLARRTALTTLLLTRIRQQMLGS